MPIDQKSEAKLSGCHPDLQRVVRRAYQFFPNSAVEVFITCGRRTIKEQEHLVRNGFSRTMRSRHIPDSRGYSHAVDFAVRLNGQVRWDWPIFDKIAAAMKKAAKLENVPIEWGGDWKSFKDGPHFQLPWKKYPAQGQMQMAGIASFDEPDSDVLPGAQEAAAHVEGLRKPVNLNALWGAVSTVGGGLMSMLYGFDWKAIAVVLGFVLLAGVLYLMVRDKVQLTFDPSGDEGA